MLKRLILTTMVLFLSLQSYAATQKLTREEAKKRLAKSYDPETPDGLLGVLQTSREDGAETVEAYLALGVPADKPITFKTTEGTTDSAYPLNFLLRFSCHDEMTVKMARLLLDAGADPSRGDEGNNGRTPAIATVQCPAVLREILARKPDLSLTDNFKRTAMSHAVVYSGKIEVVQMLLDAGFDVRPWKKQLLEEARQDPEMSALIQGKKLVPKAPPISKKTIDWKSLPPYPHRSAAEAKKMLSPPGVATTIQDHFWEGITSREPLRLALALQAGASVLVKRPVTGYSPLVLMAERCDVADDVEQQVALAESLIAAGADKTGVDANRANALTLAAHNCPFGVVRVLIAAGVPLTAVSATGQTPLREAIVVGRADVVAALLDAGVDPKKEPYNARKLASGNKEIQALLKKRRSGHEVSWLSPTDRV